jgi:P4 family phage/plasmid primase-like protien
MNKNVINGGLNEPSNVTRSISQTDTDASLLKPLLEAGYELIPLRPNGKAPTDKNWPRRPYKNKEQISHMERGGNVGVRLRASDLVIDVDPRNFEDVWRDVDPFTELVLRLGLDPTSWPRVETGGGGSHFYLTKPKDIAVVDGLADYPGVEFKTVGRQVVAPGSIHPETGRLYVWDEFEDDPSTAPAAPAPLIEAIKRRRIETMASSAGVHSAEEIADMLDVLDAEEFHDHDQWLELMMACHHASDGSARQEFIDWSIGDPEYADHEVIISKRWDSLNAKSDGGLITFRTLHKLLLEAGRADAIPRTSPEDDFDEVTTEDIPEGALETRPPLESDAPMMIATEMLKGKTLLRSNAEWYQYDRKCNYYALVADERFTSWCWKWINGRPYIDRRKSEPETKCLVAGKAMVANVEEAARALRQGPDKAPRWINKQQPNDPPAEQLLVCANGLLHLPTKTLLPPDRRFFSVNGSPVVYDPNAPKPERWLRFMTEIFPDEPDCIETLQEATGYFLTQDTSLQKIVQLVGPPRAGKGVYARVLQNLIGEGNYTSPTVKRLSGEFGLQPLIGKQLAIISDMRLGKGVNHAGLSETLLTVSGEDSVSVSRKYKENWEGKLNTRFLISSNEVLQLRDTSNALGSRMIVIITKQSFVGREDEGLTCKLMEELPGILNWAIDGLDHLRERGHFVQPKSCMTEVMQMHKLTSPVKWFLDTEIVTGTGHKVQKDRFWEAFNDWTIDEGLHYSGGKEHFIKDMNSAGARFEQSRPREKGKRIAYLNGLDLREDFLEKIHMSARRDFSGIEE